MLVSECCGARIKYSDICYECGEHCLEVTDEHDAVVLAELKYHNDDHMLQSEIEDVQSEASIVKSKINKAEGK